MMATATSRYRFTIEAGRFLAGEVERTLREEAHIRFLEWSIDRYPDFITVQLLCEVRGDADKVEDFVAYMREFRKAMGS